MSIVLLPFRPSTTAAARARSPHLAFRAAAAPPRPQAPTSTATPPHRPPEPRARAQREPVGHVLVVMGFLLFALLLSGCGLADGQRAAVAKFSAASVTLGDLAAQEFARSRADVIAMNTAALELGERTVDADTLDQFVTLERVQLRTAACDALRTYGELLRTLATADDPAALRLAADSFAASLKSFAALRIEGEQEGAISAAVQFLASGIIEAQRAERVRAIVKQSSPAVRAVADALREDFDLEGEYWQLAYDATAARLNSAATAAARDNATPEGAARAQAARALRSTSLARRDAAVSAISAAVDALVAAEKELFLVVDYPEITLGDIDAYFTRVERLAAIVRILAAN